MIGRIEQGATAISVAALGSTALVSTDADTVLVLSGPQPACSSCRHFVRCTSAVALGLCRKSRTGMAVVDSYAVEPCWEPIR